MTDQVIRWCFIPFFQYFHVIFSISILKFLFETIKINNDLIDRASIEDLEMIRIKIRNLIKYIPKKMIQYETNLNDDILSIDWHESNLENEDLKNNREQIEFYIREHQQDTEVINKLKMNTPLSKDDVSRLEDIIWHDLGTKEQYYAEYGEKP